MAWPPGGHDNSRSTPDRRRIRDASRRGVSWLQQLHTKSWQAEDLVGGCRVELSWTHSWHRSPGRTSSVWSALPSLSCCFQGGLTDDVGKHFGSEEVELPKSNPHALASGLQIRAARGFLCWDRRDLAKEAAVPSTSIERIETGDRPTSETAKNLSVIRSVLETKGIEFTEDSGVLGVRLHHSQRPKRSGRSRP